MTGTGVVGVGLRGFLESILYNEPARETLVAYFFFMAFIASGDFDTMASRISDPKFTN